MTTLRSPRVWNFRDLDCPETAVRVDRRTAWGNPFLIPRDGSREEVIIKYRHWVLTMQPASYYKKLKGKDLVCWCAPLPCHGDVLLELANRG